MFQCWRCVSVCAIKSNRHVKCRNVGSKRAQSLADYYLLLNRFKWNQSEEDKVELRAQRQEIIALGEMSLYAEWLSDRMLWPPRAMTFR